MEEKLLCQTEFTSQSWLHYVSSVFIGGICHLGDILIPALLLTHHHVHHCSSIGEKLSMERTREFLFNNIQEFSKWSFQELIETLSNSLSQSPWRPAGRFHWEVNGRQKQCSNFIWVSICTPTNTGGPGPNLPRATGLVIRDPVSNWFINLVLMFVF